MKTPGRERAFLGGLQLKCDWGESKSFSADLSGDHPTYRDLEEFMQIHMRGHARTSTAIVLIVQVTVEFQASSLACGGKD